MAARKSMEAVIAASDKDFSRAMQRASKAASGFGSAIQRAGSIGHKSLGQINVGSAIAAAGLYKLAKAGVEFGIGSVKAAADAEQAMAKVRLMVEKAGISWNDHAAQIDKVIQAQSRLSGFDDEDLAASFANMLRTTHNLNEAFRLNALAADVARAKGITLAGAQSLLARVYNGSFTGLKRLGIAIKPVTEAQDELKKKTDHATDAQKRAAKAADAIATRQRAIAQLQRQLGGQAEVYGKTTQGSLDRLKVGWENVQEAVGTAALPAVKRFTEFLNRTLLPSAEKVGGDLGRIFASDKLAIGKKFELAWRRIDQTGLPDKVKDTFFTALTTVGTKGPEYLIKGFREAPWPAKGVIAAVLLAKFGPALKMLGPALGKVVGGLGAGTTLGGAAVGAAVSKASPIPVYVVNQGFAGVPGPGGGAAAATTTAAAVGRSVIGRLIPPVAGILAFDAMRGTAGAPQNLSGQTNDVKAYNKAVVDLNKSLDTGKIKYRDYVVELERLRKAFRVTSMDASSFGKQGADAADKFAAGIARGGRKAKVSADKLADQAIAALKPLAPRARDVAADSIIAMTQALEHRRKVPVGATRTLVAQIIAAYGPLPAATKRAMANSAQHYAILSLRAAKTSADVNRALDEMGRAGRQIASAYGLRWFGETAATANAQRTPAYIGSRTTTQHRGGLLPGQAGREVMVQALPGEGFFTRHQMARAERYAPGVLSHAWGDRRHHLQSFDRGGQARAQVTNRIAVPTIAGSDFFAAVGNAVVARIGQGINQKLAQAAASGAGGGRVTASWFNDTTTASGHNAATDMGWAELSNPPGSLNFSALGKKPMGTSARVTYGGKTIAIPKIDVGAGGAGLNGTVRAIDLSAPAKTALSMPDLALVNVAFHRGGLVQSFDQGGVVAARDFARAQIGDSYSQQARLGPDSWDCSGFAGKVAAVAGSSAAVGGWTGSYWDAVKGQAEATGDAAVAWGFRGDPYSQNGGHMGIRVLGQWFDAGSGGVQSDSGSSHWEHTRVPPGLAGVTASTTSGTRGGRPAPQGDPLPGALRAVFGKKGARAVAGDIRAGGADLSGAAEAATSGVDTTFSRAAAGSGSAARRLARQAKLLPDDVEDQGRRAEIATELAGLKRKLAVVNGKLAKALSTKAKLRRDLDKAAAAMKKKATRAKARTARTAIRKAIAEVNGQIEALRAQRADINWQRWELGEEIGGLNRDAQARGAEQGDEMRDLMGPVREPDTIAGGVDKQLGGMATDDNAQDRSARQGGEAAATAGIQPGEGQVVNPEEIRLRGERAVLERRKGETEQKQRIVASGIRQVNERIKFLQGEKSKTFDAWKKAGKGPRGRAIKKKAIEAIGKLNEELDSLWSQLDGLIGQRADLAAEAQDLGFQLEDIEKEIAATPDTIAAEEGADTTGDKIQYDIAVAEGTPGTADDLVAAIAYRDHIKENLDKAVADLNWAQAAQLQSALNSVNQQITQLQNPSATTEATTVEQDWRNALKDPEAALAQAGLTAGEYGDDLAALGAIQGVDSSFLAQAVAKGDAGAIASIISHLSGIRSAISLLTKGAGGVTLNVYPSGAAGNDPRALASFLGFSLRTAV